jgi:hypothetical protein
LAFRQFRSKNQAPRTNLQETNVALWNLEFGSWSLGFP